MTAADRKALDAVARRVTLADLPPFTRRIAEAALATRKVYRCRIDGEPVMVTR